MRRVPVSFVLQPPSSSPESSTSHLHLIRSEYQNLPMHSVDELRQLATSQDPPQGIEVPLPEGDSEEQLHKLMLARLAFELAERKR